MEGMPATSSALLGATEPAVVRCGVGQHTRLRIRDAQICCARSDRVMQQPFMLISMRPWTRHAAQRNGNTALPLLGLIISTVRYHLGGLDGGSR